MEFSGAVSGAARRGRAVRKVLWLTLALNVMVACGKLVVGTLTGVLSLVADGYHSLLDGTNNVVGLVTMLFAGKPPDEDHPYGHRKFEVLASLAIALFLFVTAGKIVMEAVARLRTGGPVVPPLATILVALGTMAVNIFVTRYEARKGKELHSPFLIADAQHTMSDVYATAGVLLAILLARAGVWWADPVVAVGIGAVIVYAGYRILTSGLGVIADRSVIDTAEVEALASAVPGVRGCVKTRSRGFEDAVFLDLTLLFDPDLSLREAHDLCDRIESSLKERFPQLTDIVIHPEPDKNASGRGLDLLAAEGRSVRPGAPPARARRRENP